jgi:Tfp pilus assembly protein PilN
MRAVNLLPRQASRSKLSLDRTVVIAVAVTVLVMAALVGGFFMEKADAASKLKLETDSQAALAQAQSRQPTRHTPAPQTLQIPVVLSQEEPWHVALSAALSTRVAWDELLSDLEYVVPDKITLTSVSLGSGGDPTSGTSGGTITLGGNAYSSTDVANFLSLLARIPKLTNVTLMTSAVNVGTNVVTFQITAQMTLPAPPVAPVTDTTTTTGVTG